MVKVRSVGTCGACWGRFRLQKNGRLVHHGYRRPGTGTVVDDCVGTHCLPFEVSTESAERFIDWVGHRLREMTPIQQLRAKRDVAETERKIAKWKLKPIKTFEEESEVSPRRPASASAAVDDTGVTKRRGGGSSHEGSIVRKLPGFRRNPKYSGRSHYLVDVGGVTHEVWEARGVRDLRIFRPWGGWYSVTLLSPDGQSPRYLGSSREEVVDSLARLQTGEPSSSPKFRK